MLFLGIETSCDDTCASVVENGKEILSNIISSQDALHAKFGGVFPEMAAREHVKNILPVIDKALETAQVPLEKIDAFAATRGPGLINSVLIGLDTAKTLAWSLQKPFLAINHLEAHLYPSLMQNSFLETNNFPAIGILLSGGHTTMVLITKNEKEKQYQHIGSTVDDAIGEAFDKVAHLLGYTYPGGQKLEMLAKKGDPNAYSFRAGVVKASPHSFSFSGLKTAVRYQIPENTALSLEKKADIAASFQKAVFVDLVRKLNIAIEKYSPKSIVFGGGVTQNKYLQKLCKEKLELPCFYPPSKLACDNAAMIAMLGYEKWSMHGEDSLDIPAASKLPFFLV